VSDCEALEAELDEAWQFRDWQTVARLQDELAQLHASRVTAAALTEDDIARLTAMDPRVKAIIHNPRTYFERVRARLDAESAEVLP
jgi:Asp-tRNA(Asn)/Glu-tRNA(Gln) amidotransferase A subunit family amidase